MTQSPRPTPRNSIPQTARRTALAPALGPQVNSSLEEIEHMVKLVIDQEVSKLTSQNTKLRQELADVRRELAELRGQLASDPDDKYSLTKAKMIRLMKAHGIE